MHDHRRLRGWLRVGALLTAGALVAVVPASALAAKPSDGGFIYQRGERVALAAARTYELQGTKTAEGRCHYDYPEVRLPEGVTAWEVRDVAIDPANCVKIVEEGIPPEADLALAKDEKRIAEDIPSTGISAGGSGEAVTSTASGYNWTWWEDVVGLKVNQDRTNISWAYNGSCATSGSTSGEWSWNYGSGWQIVSYGGSDYRVCAYYRGTTYSTFKNPTFCSPLPTVYTYYYYVRTYGYASGSIGGSRSTDTVDECLPLWMHYQVRKVT